MVDFSGLFGKRIFFERMVVGFGLLKKGSIQKKDLWHSDPFQKRSSELKAL